VAGVIFHTQPSALGELLIAATARGVCLVDWGDHDLALDRLEDRHGRVQAGDGLAARAAREIHEYLRGSRRILEVGIDLSGETPFRRAVLTRLTEVPFGALTSYGELASELGTGPRAVGQAVGSNPVPVLVPCHRVVAADGTLGGYGGGLERKRLLLGLEGHGDLPGGWVPRRRRVAPAPNFFSY
jgi:methylated-DNA-[protein]-cysteine S-methyltransferase